jgi:hypothetical protein
VLVKGQYRLTFPSTAYVLDITAPIKGGKRPADFDPFTDFTAYAQRLDAGFQVGAGYRYGPALLQAGCSMGLRNLAPSDYARWSFIGTGPNYQNWALQIVLAYLVGPKN